MIYSIEKAALIKRQIAHFASTTSDDRFYLSIQLENLEFWLEEIESALKALDDYPRRLKKMQNYEKNLPHYDPLKSEIKKIPYQEFEGMRRELIDTSYAFFIRCYRLRFINERRLKELCERVGTGLDLSDLA